MRSKHYILSQNQFGPFKSESLLIINDTFFICDLPSSLTIGIPFGPSPNLSHTLLISTSNVTFKIN